MSSLDSLKELDNFQDFKNFIMSFVLESNTLQKLIYYPLSNPLDDERAIDLENPYLVFDEDSAISEDGKTGIHGVLLFKSKNNTILNASIPVVLVYFNTAKLGNSNIYDNVYITFKIIMKGEAVQTLANGLDRAYVIAKLIDDNFDKANVNDYGKVHLQSFDPLPLNEENSGYVSVYRARTLRGVLLDNKNYLQRTYGVDSREYL